MCGDYSSGWRWSGRWCFTSMTSSGPSRCCLTCWITWQTYLGARRFLLLCTARPELLDVRPGWGGGKLNATTVLLEPLRLGRCREPPGRVGRRP